MTAVQFLRHRSAAIGFLIVVVLAWEALVIIRDVPPFILPRPSRVLMVLVELRWDLLPHVHATATQALLGYLLGVAWGVSLAILLSIIPLIRSAIYPLVLATQTTPKIAIAPLFVVWFGVGLLPKILIVALLAFFPVFINTLSALDGTDRDQLSLMYSVSASRWHTYWYVRIPASIPFLFAGLKLALTVSIIGAIVAEWVAAERGLGFLLIFYNSALRTTELFAVLVVLVVVASGAFLAIIMLEKILSWERRVARDTGVADQAAASRVASEATM